MELLISAGEASGDLHGSRLLRALRANRPGLTAFGMGGEKLAAEGLDCVVSSEELSVVGIFEVFEKLPALSRALGALTREALRRRPAAAVLIDFPDFHGLLARRLARAGIPLIYYVSPQVWAWRSGRAAKLARRARRIVTLFPFEADLYRNLGADAVWAGHPLVDDVREGLERKSVPRAEPPRRRLLLLPGSRTAEVRRHWSVLRDAAVALSARHPLEVIAIRAPGLPLALFEGSDAAGVTIAPAEERHALLASADLAFVASGTATLEAALCGTPMVVVYRTSPASAVVGRTLVRIPWISLANIVAGEEVVPELLQEHVQVSRLVAEAEAILGSPDRVRRMREGLARAAGNLGPPGGSERAADAVLEVIEPGAAPGVAAVP